MEILNRMLDQAHYRKSLLSLWQTSLILSYFLLSIGTLSTFSLAHLKVKNAFQVGPCGSPVFLLTNQQGAQVVYQSQSIYLSSLGGLDRISFARRTEMPERRLSLRYHSCLPFAWECIMHTSTCPSLGYFLVLQKNILRHHPPLQAHALLFSKACAEVRCKAMLPKRQLRFICSLSQCQEQQWEVVDISSHTVGAH